MDIAFSNSHRLEDPCICVPVTYDMHGVILTCYLRYARVIVLLRYAQNYSRRNLSLDGHRCGSEELTQ